MSVTYRGGTSRDRAALDVLLRGLSAESAYSRFQAAVGSQPPPAVLEALLPDGVRGGAVLAWDGDLPVGHGVWVRVGPSRTAEVAVVVADSHQRQGVGTVLAGRLLAAAGARGITRIEVFSEARNQAVARMVARRSPGALPDRDGTTVSYSFVLGDRDRTAAAPWVA